MAVEAGGSRSWLRRGGTFAVASRLPLAVWAATTAAVLTAAGFARHHPFESGIWAHADSFLYLGQVNDGTTLFYCPGSSRTEWCGNAGWFPGYPWLIDAVHALGAPPSGASVAIAWLFGAATLILLWWTFLRRQSTYGSLMALLYAAVAPGIAFRYGVYPLSLLGFFTVLCLWLLARRRIVLAGLAGAAAVCCYPAGLALIPTAAIWLVAPLSRAGRWRRVRQALLGSGLIGCGLVVVLVAQWIEVGHPDAYFLVQSKYGHSLREPFAPFHQALFLGHGSVFALRNIPYLETIALTITLAAVVIAVLAERRQASSEEVLLLVWIVLAWLLTSVPAHLSHYREDAVLLPLAPLVRRLPRPLSAAVVLVAAGLVVPMTILYVHGRLP